MPNNFFKKMLSRLTDNYNKDENSNVAKVIKLIADELEELTESTKRVRDWRDIDQAEGATLDRLGYNVQQFRGLAGDDIYRVLIKSRIARNRSDGSINTIIRVLSLALDSDPSEIRIVETYDDPFEPEPAGISVIEVPIAKLLEIGMTGEQFGRMVAKTAAAGVGVKAIELYGTFEFGTVDSPPDFDTGFSSVLDPESGGTLGMLYTPEDDIYFPLD